MPRRVFILFLLVIGGIAPVHAQRGTNPGLLNIREISAEATINVGGEVDTSRFTLSEREVGSWLRAAVDTSDFGKAARTGMPSDSIATLLVSVGVQAEQGDTLLATALFQVMRPGYVINIPAEQALYDVPVMQSVFALSGDDQRLQHELRSLIRQFVQFTSVRIRQHNPAVEGDVAGRDTTAVDTAQVPPADSLSAGGDEKGANDDQKSTGQAP